MCIFLRSNEEMLRGVPLTTDKREPLPGSLNGEKERPPITAVSSYYHHALLLNANQLPLTPLLDPPMLLHSSSASTYSSSMSLGND